MKKYLKLYKKFIQANIAVDLSFRTSFISLLIMDILFYISLFKSIDFIFLATDNIVGYTHQEMTFFISFMILLNQMQMTFFSSSYWQLADDLKNGKLDFYFLRPAATIFSIFFQHMKFSRALLSFYTIPNLIYQGIKLGLTTSDWILLPFAVIFSFAIFISIEIILSLGMFWTIEGDGINFFRLQLQRISRWPRDIYTNYVKKLFSIGIPVLLIGNMPLEMLKHKRPLIVLNMFIIMLLLWGVLAIVWNKAQARYESASS